MDLLTILPNLLETQSLSISEIRKILTQTKIEFSSEDLPSMLDGLCMLGKIKRDGENYCGIGYEVQPKKRGRKKTAAPEPAITTDDVISFSDDEESAKQKVDDLLFGPLLIDPVTVSYFEKEISNTGRIVYDAMNTRFIAHEVTIGPNDQETANIEIEHKRRISKFSFSVKCVGGKIEFYALTAPGRSANLKHNDLQFEGYSNLREFLLSNL